MDKAYKRYLESRGINNSSAIGRFAMYPKENTIMDNYIAEKERIRDMYLTKREEDEIAERMARLIEKHLEDLLRSWK